ncbi:MAG: hypothetical protein KDD25_07140, partial [Bdellovibrionales bacterium]|nr:hypothetical protein [Bdellovibrionales bacterium]
MRLPRVSVWISGTGSNLAAILECHSIVDVSLVVSSKTSALGILKAKRAGVEVLVLDKKIDWQSLHQIHLDKKIDLIYLAGFMKVVPSSFVERWSGKMISVHPSL